MTIVYDEGNSGYVGQHFVLPMALLKKAISS
jgi:hypothetical protein